MGIISIFFVLSFYTTSINRVKTMKKVLFLIRDLGHGGAEKVLVNLVNHMDRDKFDITVMTLFDEGVNKQFLAPHIKYKTCFCKSFPANSHFLKLFSPAFLHKHFIKDSYDIEIAFLEGPAARVISGCKNKNTKLLSWIHCTQKTKNDISIGFRHFVEANNSYKRFNKIVFVSESTKITFNKHIPIKESIVLYNTNDSETIKRQSDESIAVTFNDKIVNIVSTGRLIPVKGYDRLIKVHSRLINEGYSIHTYILGEGSDSYKSELTKLINDNNISDSFTFLGYQTNPYKYVSKADLFVCSSHSEGFSTAATEALIVGTPVCTVEVSGMKEMLGENNEYGIITENTEEALYQGIKSLLDSPELLAHYKEKAIERSKFFSTEKTVKAVENMLLKL